MDFRDRPSGSRFLVLAGADDDTGPVMLFNFFAHSDRTITITPSPLTAIRSDLDRFGFCHFAAATLSGDDL